jgi:serine protease Do
MLSEGGGSEGLGFAIPAAIVKFDYENLRRFGHVRRVAIGAPAQSITPTLAAGLGLSRSLRPIDQAMTITVLRGQTPLSVALPVTVHHDKTDDLADVLPRTFIAELGMFVSYDNYGLQALRAEDDVDSAIVVIAQAAGPNAITTGVATGDIIRAINRTPLQSVSQLQSTVRQFKPGDALVLEMNVRENFSIAHSKWIEVRQ